MIDQNRKAKAVIVVQRFWLVLLFFAGSVSAVVAQRPPAAKLLPYETLAYISVGNAAEFKTRLQETSIARIGKDDQLRPFIKHLYGSANEAFSQVKDRVGGSLDELLQIPRGEICLAFVASQPTDSAPDGEQGEDATPQFVAFVDVGDNLDMAQRVVGVLCDRLVADGGERSAKTVQDAKVVVIDLPTESQAVFFAKEQTIVFASSFDLAKRLLADWGRADEVQTLHDNPRFAAALTKWLRAEGGNHK